MRAQSLLINFPIARGLSFEIYIATIKTTVSPRIDVTPNVCVAMDVNDGPVSSSEDSLQTQTPTPLVSDASNNTTPSAKPPRSADTAGSSPSPCRMGMALPRRTLFGVCPTTGNTTLEYSQTSRIRDASQTHTHLLPRPCTMGSRRKTLCGISGGCWLLL